MTDCVNKLNANNWDGTECKPNAANGTELGSSFGFYKSHSHMFHDPLDCWRACVGCLLEGIDDESAVTTHCDYTVQVAGRGINAHCGMGFDYRN